MNTPLPHVNHFALLVVIVLGVTGGNLLSNYVTLQAAAYAAKLAMEELHHRNNAALQQSAERSAIRKLQLRSTRRDDPYGKHLARACADWRAADADLHTRTTGIEVARNCTRFDNYVETGQLPPSR
jgi:hypothetical protein